MIRYNLLLFLRNLKRQKLFSSINLLGLTISIASALLIYLYVRHEFSYDNFHPHADRLYRVNQTFIWGEDSDNQFSRTGPGVAHAVNEELAEVEITTSLHTPWGFIISYTTPVQEVITFEENEILAADSNFFSVFNFPLIKGDQASAFRQANTLVMTKSTAEKYFKNEDPIGKLVRLRGGSNSMDETFEVIGVTEDVPANSTIQFDILLSIKNFPVEELHWSWIWTQLETFVRLDANADINNVRKKLALIPQKRAEETLQRVMNMSYDDYIKSGKRWELFLQPITSLHLPDEIVFGSFPDTGNLKIIYALISAAVFIVLLSCINFMNLSTAQFTRRIKEASVRKILGLSKKALAVSYFLEALIFCSIAVVIACALVQALLPAFNQLTGKTLRIAPYNDFILWTILPALPLLMAIVSSSYPALFLTTFNPAATIKGKMTGLGKGNRFRSAMVVFQFTISIMLIICTGIVYQQLNYASEKDLGFDKENLLVLEHVETIKNNASFADAALNVAGATNVSLCTSAPPKVFGGDSFTAEGMNGRTFPLIYTSADDRYLPTLNIKLKYGRNILRDNPGDKDRVILNEAAIRKIGWDVDESALGKKIMYPGSNVGFEVVGIVADFNYWSITTPIEPMAIFHLDNPQIEQGQGHKKYLVMKIASQNTTAWAKTFATLSDLWKRHAGDIPFQYSFVDQTFAETFVSQQRFGNVLSVMTALAVSIACLGLLGMIIYALEQRTKEIGIRKISGASAWNILILVTQRYTKLTLIAFIIGAPTAYWIMTQWLAAFAYRITPSLWIFVAAGGGTFFIAMIITGYYSLQAALANPVDVLRDE